MARTNTGMRHQALRCGTLFHLALGFSYFDAVEIHYVHVALVFPAVLIVYYLVWKYLIGFCNQVVGITE